MDFKDVQMVPAKDPTTYQRYKKTILLAAFIGAIILICCVIGVLKYISPKQRIIRAINDSDYTTAAQIQEKYSTTLDDEYDTVLIDKINSVQSDFANGTIDYENAVSYISIIRNIGNNNVVSFASTIENEINSINSSKIAFSKGKELFNSGDYENAIKALNSVVIADLENYTDAQKILKDASDSYRTVLFAEVDKIIENNQLEDAQSLLLKATEVLPNDTQISDKLNNVNISINNQAIEAVLTQAKQLSKDNLLAAIQLIQKELPKQNNDIRLKEKLEEYTEKYLESLISQVQAHVNNNNYDQAFTLLNKANSDLPSNQTIINKIDEITKIKQQKEREIQIAKDLQEAENIFKAQGYEQAISLLQSSEYSSSQEILNAIANYETYKPINLFSMDFWDSNNNVTRVAGPYSIQDNLGNEHPNSYSIYDIAFTTYVTYRIDGQYNHLNGLYFLEYEHRSTSYKGTFRVYGDDDTVLFSTTLEKGMDPVKFSVDISGVKDLKLEYISSAWMADFPAQYYNFSDVTVSK